MKHIQRVDQDSGVRSGLRDIRKVRNSYLYVCKVGKDREDAQRLGFFPEIRKQPCNEALLFMLHPAERGALLRLGIKGEDGNSTVLHWGRQIPGGAPHILTGTFLKVTWVLLVILLRPTN